MKCEDVLTELRGGTPHRSQPNLGLNQVGTKEKERIIRALNSQKCRTIVGSIV